MELLRELARASLGLVAFGTLLLLGAGALGRWLPLGEQVPLAWRGLGPRADPDIYMVDLSRRLPYNLTRSAAWDGYPALAPDGRRLAFSSFLDGNGEIYLMDWLTGERLRLTDDPAFDGYPAWSPDGAHLAFVSNRANANDDIYLVEPGGAPPRRLTDKVGLDTHPAWSPDGDWIAYVASDGLDPADLYVMPLACPEVDGVCGRVSQRLTNQPGFDFLPVWSPDGDWIAFTSDRGGSLDVYLLGTACLQDGTECVQNPRRLTHSGIPINGLFWSQGGARLLLVELVLWPEVYAIAADCDQTPGGCVVQQLTAIGRSPWAWYP